MSIKIYLVASTSKSWMNTGYGHGLCAAGGANLLVSFEEFSKNPSQKLAVTTMQFPYDPKAQKEEPKQ